MYPRGDPMSDTPFGFNRPGDGDDDRPQDPFKGMGGDMAQFADMLHRFADMIGGQGAGGAPTASAVLGDILRAAARAR